MRRLVSADGRHLAYGRSRTWIAPVDKPSRRRSLPGQAWAWAPRVSAIAVVAPDGAVAVFGLGTRPLAALPRGFGATSIAWTPDGRTLAVSGSRFPRRPYRQEIWLVHPVTRSAQLVAGSFAGGQTPELAGFSPDGGWLLWWPRIQNSASLAADGTPLAAGGGRGTRADKRIVAAKPPLWQTRSLSRDRRRSWVSPAYSPDGRSVATAARPGGFEPHFGRERRSLWLLSLDGRARRRLTRPPSGLSDEFPRWSSDGRFLLFVRSGPTAPNATAGGSLYLLPLGGRPVGPLADLGSTSNSYGHYSWFDQLDWRQPVR